LQIYNNRLYNVEFYFVKVCIHFFLADPVYVHTLSIIGASDRMCCPSCVISAGTNIKKIPYFHSMKQCILWKLTVVQDILNTVTPVAPKMIVSAHTTPSHRTLSSAIEIQSNSSYPILGLYRHFCVHVTQVFCYLYAF